MAKQFNVDQFKSEAVKPLFAVAGATEIAVDRARAYAADAQKVAQDSFDALQARVAKVERDPKALQNQAVSALNTRIEELSNDAREAQAKFESRVEDLSKDARDIPARLQKQLEDAISELTDTYADLAVRGEKFVAAIRKDGVKAVTVKAKSAKKAAAKKAPAKKAAPVAKKSPVKKTAAKKAASKSA